MTNGVAAGAVTRTLAFVRKESVEVVRQPRLLLTLVLGPFLVLFLFGLGFSDELPRFRALFVAPEGSAVAHTIDRFSGRLASYIDYRGVVADGEEARERLRRGEVDVVAVLPTDPYESVRQSRRAVIEVYHDALDPIVGAAIEVAARLAADEINRQLLASVVARGQEASDLLDEVLPPLEGAVAAAHDALVAGDRARAEGMLAQAAPPLTTLADQVAVTLVVADDLRGGAQGASAAALELRDAARALADPASASLPVEERLAQVEAVQALLASVRTGLESVRGVNPAVLVRPFRAVTRPLGARVSSAFDFYVPSVLMLLVQHLGVTFSSLSLVRERQLGTTELLAVAPVSAGEVLVGKYGSYLLLGGGVAAALTVLLRVLLEVPFAGSGWHFAVAVVVVLLGALGIGFVISAVSQTDSQAVQLSMIVLLASFFFSGFFLSLDRLDPAVQWLGRALPVTHGIAIARDVMLRGRPAPAGPLLLAAAIALVTFAVSWWRLREELRVR